MKGLILAVFCVFAAVLYQANAQTLDVSFSSGKLPINFFVLGTVHPAGNPILLIAQLPQIFN